MAKENHADNEEEEEDDEDIGTSAQNLSVNKRTADSFDMFVQLNKMYFN